MLIWHSRYTAILIGHPQHCPSYTLTCSSHLELLLSWPYGASTICRTELDTWMGPSFAPLMTYAFLPNQSCLLGISLNKHLVRCVWVRLCTGWVHFHIKKN